MNLQPLHLLILVLVVLLIFGAKKLPSVASSVGQSLKIFKNEVKELREDGGPGAGPAAPGSSAGDGDNAGTRAGDPDANRDLPTAGSPPRSS